MPAEVMYSTTGCPKPYPRVLLFVVLLKPIFFQIFLDVSPTDPHFTEIKGNGETREPVHGVMELHSVTSIVDSSLKPVPLSSLPSHGAVGASCWMGCARNKHALRRG